MLLLKSFKKYPDRSMVQTLEGDSHLHSLSLRIWVYHPNTRIYVRLLGPCFKTGRIKPLSQHPKLKFVSNSARQTNQNSSVNKLSQVFDMMRRTSCKPLQIYLNLPLGKPKTPYFTSPKASKHYDEATYPKAN